MNRLESTATSLARAKQIDRLCDEFEHALLVGQCPRIDDYLLRCSLDARDQLQSELHWLEIDYGGHVEPAATDFAKQSFVQRLTDHAAGAAAGARLPESDPFCRTQCAITLHVVGGPNKGQCYRFDEHDVVVVGRGRASHIKLPPKDKYFSRHHFLLEVNPPRCRLTNLSQSNGTFVNGIRVSAAELTSGDLILAGDTAIEIRIDASSSQSLVGPPAPIGSQLGDYQLIQELGRGRIGVVFLARHVTSGDRRAIKVLHEQGSDDRLRRRFFLEAAECEQLQHENIVAHFGGQIDGQASFFVMEHVHGSDAQRILATTGRLAVSRAVDWALQLLAALEYAHARGLVHQGIKPTNLLIRNVGQNEQLKLADFGVARACQSCAFSGMTFDANIAGSLPFMAPEQITHYRQADPRSDVYAVGSTLYTLLTGQFIHDFPPTLADQIVLVLEQPAVEIAKRRSNLPTKLSSILGRALAKQPGARFARAADMRQALQAL